MKSLALISCLQKLQYLSFVTTPKWWVCSILQPFYMLQNYPGWLNCQHRALLRCDLGPGLDIMGTRHRMSPARPCNYKYTQLHIRNIAKYYQRFFASTLENGLIFEYFELSITWWYFELWPGDEEGNEPSPAETITSLPHPALSFVVFQNREQEDLSSSLPRLPGHLLSCDRMLSDLHVAGFHVAQIRLLFWWHSHLLTFVHSYLSQSKQFAILENQDPETEGRGRQGRAQAPRALPFSGPHGASYPWVAACLR